MLQPSRDGNGGRAAQRVRLKPGILNRARHAAIDTDILAGDIAGPFRC
jgi:hypothetical protein